MKWLTGWKMLYTKMISSRVERKHGEFFALLSGCMPWIDFDERTERGLVQVPSSVRMIPRCDDRASVL